MQNETSELKQEVQQRGPHQASCHNILPPHLRNRRKKGTVSGGSPVAATSPLLQKLGGEDTITRRWIDVLVQISFHSHPVQELVLCFAL